MPVPIPFHPSNVWRRDDAKRKLRPSAEALAAAREDVAVRRPFRFMLSDIRVTDDTLRGVDCSYQDAKFSDAPFAAVLEEQREDEERMKDEDYATSIASARASVLLFGRREDGPTVCVRADGFRPWFRVEVPDEWTDTDHRRFVFALAKSLCLPTTSDAGDAAITFSVERRKRFYGWVPDRRRPWVTRRFVYLRLAFASLRALQAAMRKIKASALANKTTRWTLTKLPDDFDVASFKNTSVQAYAKWSGAAKERALEMYLHAHGQIPLRIADHLQSATSKFCNDLGVGPSEWVSVACFGPTLSSQGLSSISNCDIEVAVKADASSLFSAYDDVALASRPVRDPVRGPVSVSVVSTPGPTLVATPALEAWAAALGPGEFASSPLHMSKRVREWRAAHVTLPETVRRSLLESSLRSNGALVFETLLAWKPSPLAIIAPLVIASFDCEMYSDDDTFPDVIRGHSTKYIGTNFRVGGPSGPLVRVMQCVGAVSKPDPTPDRDSSAEDVEIHVECYNTERECYEAWRDLIVSVDPDILVSWNGFGFDFPFMHADYMQTFASGAECFTEGMQHAMRARARAMLASSVPPVPPVSPVSPVFPAASVSSASVSTPALTPASFALSASTVSAAAAVSCPELLMRLRALLQTANPTGWREMRALLKTWSRIYGGKFVKALVAAEKVVKAVDTSIAARERMSSVMHVDTSADMFSIFSAALIANASGELDQTQNKTSAEDKEGKEDSDGEDDDGDNDDDNEEDENKSQDSNRDRDDYEDHAFASASISASASASKAQRNLPQDTTTAVLVKLSSLPAADANKLRLELRDRLRDAVTAATQRLNAIHKQPTRHVVVAEAELSALATHDPFELPLLLDQLALRPSMFALAHPYTDPLLPSLPLMASASVPSVPSMLSSPPIQRSARDDFFDWVASQKCLGAGVVRLLVQSTLNASSSHSKSTLLPAPRRGLFLSRLSAERCELTEKRMNSAAKGDNVYNFYRMAGRTPADLMQIVKDDKKPEDNSLRFAAETWLGASKKSEKDEEGAYATARANRGAQIARNKAALRAAKNALACPPPSQSEQSHDESTHDESTRDESTQDAFRAGMKRPREHERTDAETKALEAVAADMRAVRTAVCKAEDAFDAARVAVPVAVPASDPAFAHASFPIPAPVSAPAPEKRDRGDHKEQEKDNKGDKDKGDKGDKNKAKLDLSSSEMFRLYRAGASDPVKRWPIVEYCARDCDIPLLLVEKLKYVTIWVEMSRVCFTPLEAVVNAGQQQKVFNVIARYVNQEFAINVRDAGWPTNDAQDAGENEDGDDGGARSRVSDYQGATVIEPIKGFYSLPVSTLDFASLYPSIIRFYNLCPSVLVIDEEFFNWDKNPACKGRVTFERHTIPHNIVVGSSIKPGSRKRTPDYCVEERTYIIVTHVPGVLPRLLAQLGTTRKIAKKAMEHAGARSSECDSVASFLRGLCLSASPQTAEVELSALKAQGKSAADKLRTAQLGVDIGTAAFRVSPAASDSDCSALSEARSFEARVVAKLNERSESVRAELQALIASGATEDTARKQRTLVRELEMFAASVVAIQKDSSANATTTEAEPGTGTAPGTQRTQIDTSLLLPAFSKHIASYSQQAKAHYLDMSVQNGRQLGIKITMNSVYGFTGVSADKGLLPCKPVAAITTLKGRAFIGVAKDYAEKTYAGARVIYGDTDSIMIYWGQDISIEDAYARGGDAAAAITALLRSGTVEGLGGAGYEAARIAAAKAARAGATDPEDVDTEDEEEGRDRDRDGDRDGERDRDKHRVKRSPVRDFEEARKAIELTNEKVYFPYLLDKKKRYAGLHWAMDEELGRLKSKLDMKGIDAVRRDRPGYVRSTCEAVLRALMFERSVSKAREHIEASLESILASSGRGSSFDTGFGAAAVPAKPKPISEFVMSKSVRGSYKNGVENLPQVQAWRRMQARGDDDIPPIGARMPYVIVAPPGGVAGGTKSQVKLFARSEHPSHVKSVGLPLDIVYYLEQLQKPVSKLVEHVGIKGLDELFDTTISRANAKLMGLRSLARFLVTDTSHSTASAAAPVAAPVAARVPRAPIRIGTLGPHKTFAEPLFAPRSAQSLHQTQHKTQQQTQFARHFGASSKAEPEKAKSKSNESKVSKDGNPKPIAKPPRSSKSLLDMLEHA